MPTESTPHKIVFLDASTVGSGDVDLSRFEDFGTFDAYPTTSPEEKIEHLHDATIAITNKVVLDQSTLEHCPQLRLICVSATGVNNIDLDAARSMNIPVCNVAGYSTNSVAQHTISLLLNLATNHHRLAQEHHKWPHSPIFTRLDHPVTEIAGKTLGIAGAGAIGSAVGRAAEALGMNIQTLARPGSGNPTNTAPWPRVAKDNFFQTSDAISLHCPLNDETRHLINLDTLALMNNEAFLINTGRGELIDEPALADALRSGHLGGAALDVLSIEPPPHDHPLLAPDIPNLILTPHTAWISREARERLISEVAANIRAFLDGTPRNLVT
ncbi:MAG: D-2-hydroxyacid dehydrogenase [Verrucomicrobiota bacterium]